MNLLLQYLLPLSVVVEVEEDESLVVQRVRVELYLHVLQHLHQLLVLAVEMYHLYRVLLLLQLHIRWSFASLQNLLDQSLQGYFRKSPDSFLRQQCSSSDAAAATSSTCCTRAFLDPSIRIEEAGFKVRIKCCRRQVRVEMESLLKPRQRSIQAENGSALLH